MAAILHDTDWTAPPLVYQFRVVTRWPDDKTYEWTMVGTNSEAIRAGFHQQLCGAVGCEFFRVATLGPDDQERF